MWLWGSLTASAAFPAGQIYGPASRLALAAFADVSSLRGQIEALRGQSILIFTKDQATAAYALLELDGVARRIVLVPPDLSPAHLPLVVRDSEATVLVCDGPSADLVELKAPSSVVLADPTLGTSTGTRRQSCESEWVLLTSGTTGAPKLVLHSLRSLTSAFAGQDLPGEIIWGTFYDIRRYGGLQIFLRALHHGSFVLSGPEETTPDFLTRAASAGVTHVSGTPSHWRRALMSGAADRIDPRYVRLSGEIADQGILDALRAAFPGAVVAHAFASTEAGVGFEVRDGLAGFPAALARGAVTGVEIDVSGGILRLRSEGNATRYLNTAAPPLKDADGFVDTTDRVELQHGRYVFMGRAGGVINVGGLKVYPEEVEAVINAHPQVRMSLVRSRRSAITGAIVVADVVLTDASGADATSSEIVKGEILEGCRKRLAAHKVPATIRFVPALDVTAAGKLVRSNA